MHNKAACFTANKDDWGTPDWVFNFFNYHHGPFDYDLCANDENHKCEKYFTKENSVFDNNFSGKVFCNPPYGHKFINEILSLICNKINRNIVQKAVLLLPCSTSNKWFHDYVLHSASALYFFDGRLKFIGSSGVGAPFSSIAVLFDGYGEVRPLQTFSINARDRRYGE